MRSGSELPGKEMRIMFTLRIAYNHMMEQYSKAMLPSNNEHSLFGVPFMKISDMYERTGFRIESD